MEGPTPVSALIHAATMVTAGVFLFIRLSFFLTEGSPFVKGVIGLIGFGTAFVASMTALFQNDVKRIIAFSTCSQLGYMVGVIALSGYLYSLYHLINHGFFKALLFLSAGLIIHAMREEQDLRRMGALFYNLPITYLFLLVASASLIGFPYLSGFYSKELIIQYTYLSSLPLSLLFYHLALFTIICTTFYSFRLLFYIFLLPPRGPQLVHQESEEDGSYHGVYDLLFLLFFLSIFSGYLLSDLFFGIGTTPFDGAVA
jgi:NADH:ubiquinone oxidoreductase subunit 5 (subunit L)/multisubunit Na+/H+ antiporter MnhA subunit